MKLDLNDVDFLDRYEGGREAAAAKEDGWVAGWPRSISRTSRVERPSVVWVQSRSDSLRAQGKYCNTRWHV